ncbi:hypothetical protein [Paraburkholderia terrae]|uniref:hypothetical protein n=1 Tax=Paraburkholderia terrae TaxID=311230 RepID=UPI002069E41D|nr:hypothetical protein [Paraburkholderia terrae]BDC37933.1 hypothetical protein PTKU15_12300 [Paraburkholderia terrae]
MFEWLFASIPYGLLYTVGKDIHGYLTWEVKDKLVDREWLEKSGFHAQCEAQGIKLGWVNAERVATLELDGWAVLYELDKPKRIRYRLVRKGEEVPTLMGTQKA